MVIEMIAMILVVMYPFPTVGLVTVSVVVVGV